MVLKDARIVVEEICPSALPFLNEIAELIKVNKNKNNTDDYDLDESSIYIGKGHTEEKDDDEDKEEEVEAANEPVRCFFLRYGANVRVRGEKERMEIERIVYLPFLG